MSVRVTVSQEHALRHLMESANAIGPVAPPSTGGGGTDASSDAERVVAWLGRARLLFGVPFEYLVPDDGLLRPETLRTFHLDRNWTDAVVDGALAAGTFGTRDRVNLQNGHAEIREAVDDAEREQWQRAGFTGDTPSITGFLMRSRAVSGWPGMHVRAFRGRRKLLPVRIERLSPAVMLAMFDDEPDRMEIEEPRQGIQFGFRTPIGDTSGRSWAFVARNREGDELGGEQPTPFRRGSVGVVHVDELRERIAAALTASGDPRTADSIEPSEFAQQLVRYPHRQNFGAAGPGERPGFDAVMTPLVDVEQLIEWHGRFER